MSGSTSFGIGYIIGMLIVLVVVVGGPIAIGYLVAGRMAKKNGVVGSVKWPIRAGFALSFFLLLAFCVGQMAPAQADEISSHG